MNHEKRPALFLASVNWPLLIAFLVALVICASFQAHAAEPAPAPGIAVTGGVTPQSVVQWLTPLLVPVLIAGVKQVLPKLPSFVIPILAPVLGIAIEALNVFATGKEHGFLVAAALGLAGVGLREVKETLKPAPNGGWPQT